MNNYPFVSVIMPIYNAKAKILQSLNSVLNQDYPLDRYEVIAVDDGSVNGSDRLIQGFSVRLIRQNNRGSASARNLGFSNAKGEIIIFLDSDCIVGYEWIKSHVIEHSLNKDAGCIGGAFAFPQIRSKFFEVCDYYSSWYEQHPRCPPSSNYEYLPSTNLSFRRQVFENISGFNTNLRTGEDVDICRRLREKGKKILFRPHIVIYHYGRGNMIDFLNHHYGWGRHAPVVRRFGSGLRFNFLFRRNIIWSICCIFPIAVGYTLYIVFRWLHFIPIRIIALIPMIFMAKLAYAIGIVKSTIDIKIKR